MLKALFLGGVDTFRMNFSHGTHEDHAKVYRAIRALEKETGRAIGILQDLQGTKTRVGTIRNGKIIVEATETIRFVRSGADGDRTSISLPHPEVFAAMAPGQDLLIDDGRVRVRVSASIRTNCRRWPKRRVMRWTPNRSKCSPTRVISTARKSPPAMRPASTFMFQSLLHRTRARRGSDKDEFVYDHESDHYVCPAGQHLTRRMTVEEKDRTLHVYWAGTCGDCLLKSDCTTGEQRRVRRWEHEEVRERARLGYAARVTAFILPNQGDFSAHAPNFARAT